MLAHAHAIGTRPPSPSSQPGYEASGFICAPPSISLVLHINADLLSQHRPRLETLQTAPYAELPSNERK